MGTLTDVEMYNLLVGMAGLISKTKYARFFALKGGLVLMSKLFEYNRAEMFRRTSDIDIHCSNKDIWLNFCKECELILNQSSEYRFKLIKQRSATKGLDTSDSLTFEVRLQDGRVAKVGMDMNIKSDSIIEVSFSQSLGMVTYSDYTMLADKIVVVSSQSVYRRIKDLYDICVLASIGNFELEKIWGMLYKKHNKKSTDLTNMLTKTNFEVLYHAYNKFTGILNKPDFMTILDIAQKFLHPLYADIHTNYKWDNRGYLWVRH